MCCAKNCYPGFKDFTISLPVTKKTIPDPETSKLFQHSHAEQPIANVPWKTKLISKVDQSTVKLQLTPNGNRTAAPEYLFSEDGQISSDQKQQFVKQPDGSYLLTIARSEFPPEGKSKLPAVIKAGKNHYFISPSYPKSAR